MNRTYTMTGADFAILDGYAANGNYVEYYRKLESLGDRYATLAQGVASANTFEGNLARQYAQNAAGWKSGTPITISGDKWLNISKDLLQADWQIRKDTFSGQNTWSELNWDKIRDYHLTAFTNHGLPPESWTAKIPLEANLQNAPNVWEGVLSSTGTRLFTQLMIGLEQAGTLVDTSIAQISFLFSTGQYAKLLALIAVDIATDLARPSDVVRPAVLWFRAMFAAPDGIIDGNIRLLNVTNAISRGALFSALGGGTELVFGAIDKPGGGKIFGGTRSADNFNQATDDGDIFVGFDGNDTFITGRGDDFAYGLSGNDKFIANKGNDLYDGGGDFNVVGARTGRDFDSVDYSSSPGEIKIDLSTLSAGQARDRVIEIKDDGFGDFDILRDIELLILSKHADLVNFSNQQPVRDASLTIDAGGQKEGSGDKLDLASYTPEKPYVISSSSGKVTFNGFFINNNSLVGTGLTFKNFEILYGTDKGDIISGKTDFKNIYLGNGNNLVQNLSGGVLPGQERQGARANWVLLHLGEGNSTVEGVTAPGSEIFADGTQHHNQIAISPDILIHGLTKDDRLNYKGRILTGGTKQFESDDPWYYNPGMPDVKYGLNGGGQLVIDFRSSSILAGLRSFLGLAPRVTATFVDNFRNYGWDGEGTPGTANINLIAIKSQGGLLKDIIKPPGAIVGTFQAMVGPISKAWRGQTWSGKTWSDLDPLILDLGGHGIDLNALSAGDGLRRLAQHAPRRSHYRLNRERRPRAAASPRALFAPSKKRLCGVEDLLIVAC